MQFGADLFDVALQIGAGAGVEAIQQVAGVIDDLSIEAGGLG
jgi:hypothetical protein